MEELEGKEGFVLGVVLLFLHGLSVDSGHISVAQAGTFNQCAASGDVLAVWVVVLLPVERASAIKFCCGYSHAVVPGTALRR